MLKFHHHNKERESWNKETHSTWMSLRFYSKLNRKKIINKEQGENSISKIQLSKKQKTLLYNQKEKFRRPFGILNLKKKKGIWPS